MAAASSGAEAAAIGSPGVLSGNIVQVPVHIPVNVCGNTIDVVGILNPAFGNACVNGSAPRPSPATAPDSPAYGTPVVRAPPSAAFTC